MKKRLTTLLVMAYALVVQPSVVVAVITPIVHMDTPPCDVLAIPQIVDELGFAPPFPLDERLDAFATITPEPACPVLDDPMVPNALVMITNLTIPPREFTDVWYVADRETTLSNPDGVAGSPGLAPGLAFKIDAVGSNTPLVMESGPPDGIWMPGETWTFIIQDYMNTLGLLPAEIDSIGVPSTASPPSSGSIIAYPVPEPAAGISSLMIAGILMRRRR